MKIELQGSLGLKTKEAVVNEAGQVLIPPGMLITAPIQRALEKQHIEYIEVADNDEPTKAADDSCEQDDPRQDHIRNLFTPHPNELMQELKRCLLKKLN